MIRVAINGYGRIGRNVHRQFISNTKAQVQAINTRRIDPKLRGHLLKYDSLHGKLDAEVQVKESSLVVNGNEVLLIAEQDDYPWKELDIDIVVDATGKNTSYELAHKHIECGAKKVIVSAPMKDDTPTFVIGVNEDQLKPEHDVVSNASCTTNCIAPVLMVLDEVFGVENAIISSIHSFTTSQNLLDNTGRDLRRARSAVQSVIPTTTGSIKATSLILPSLKGKLDGMAFRVPIATSSCADMRLVLKKETTPDEINSVLLRASKTDRLKDVLGISDEPLVSIDFKTDPRSSIIDTMTTKVVGGKYVQLLSWYDNEWGYATRLTELVTLVARYI